VRRKNISSELFLSDGRRRFYLPNQSYELQDSYQSQHPRKDHQPPIRRRFLILLIGGIGGCICAFRGASLRGGSGFCLILLGLLSFTVGIALWFALGFSSSWGWMI
jgi:hypothetical protein